MSGTISLTGPSTTPGAPEVSPTAINNAVNTALATKLPLTGGTLTGPLIGTAVSLSGTLAATGAISGAAASFTGATISNVSGTGTLTLGAGGTNHLVLSAQLAGTPPQITGTSADGLTLTASSNGPVRIGTTLNITPANVVSGTSVPLLKLATNISGAMTQTIGLVDLSNSADNAAITGAGGATGYPLLNVSRQFGGAGTNGGRNAGTFTLTQTAAVAANTTGGQYVSLISFATATANAGGTAPTSGNAIGDIYAFYPQTVLKAGATGFNSCNVAEADIGIEATRQLLTIGGVIVAGDVLTLTFTGASIAGSPLAISTTAGTGNVPEHLVNALWAAAVNSAALQAAGVSAVQNIANFQVLDIVWPQSATVSVAATTTGAETLALGSVVTGASSRVRTGFGIIRAISDSAQGVELDKAFSLGGFGHSSVVGRWRNGIVFESDAVAETGTMIGYQLRFNLNLGVSQGYFGRQAAKYGIDWQGVNFTLAGGASLRMPGFQVDGTGGVALKNATLKTDTTGLTIDVVGKVGSGNPAVVSGGGGGAGVLHFNYFVGDIVYDALGGQYLVATVDPSTGAVTALTTLVQPSTATASLGVGIATTGGSGTGLTITPTGVANTGLAVMPTAGGKIGFNGATPVVKPTGVAITAAAIHAALTALGLIAP